jgi:hypothetical protein
VISANLPTTPPSHLTLVASGNFQSPTDAVSSPDGSEFYFAALDIDGEPAIFQTSSEPGSVAEKVIGGSPLVMPFGLVLSCDGAALYIADLESEGEGGTSGAIFKMATGGGAITQVGASGISRPSGLAMGPGCDTLYVTGRTSDDLPALFSMPIGGGAARTVWKGAPMVDPTGLYVDTREVAWVMDSLEGGVEGGALFAIPSDGSDATPVVSGLYMGTPGGVSLTAGGGTAVMPTLDLEGHGQLTVVDIASGKVSQISTPELIEPAGIRTARRAGVFAVVDASGAIYRAD